MRELVRKWFETGKSIFVLTAIPLIFTVLFSALYSLTYVEGIPLAVFDMDRSRTSETVIQNFADSAGFDVYMYAGSEAEMREAFLSGAIKAGIILPENFGSDVRENRSPKVSVMIDGSNIFIGNNAYFYAASILSTLNAGIQARVLEAGGMTPFTALSKMKVLIPGERMLYVPQMGNFVYAFAGFLGIFIQQTYMSILAPVFISEKRRLRGLKEDKRPVFAVKDISLFILLTVVALISCLLTAHVLGGYPLKGNIFLTLLTHLIFILDITAMTIFISAFFNDPCHCIQFILLLSIPTLMTSGYIWPEFVMPALFAPAIKAIWPLHYFVLPLRGIMLKGAGFGESARYMAGGLIYAAVWFPIALFTFWAAVRLTSGSRGSVAQVRE